MNNYVRIPCEGSEKKAARGIVTVTAAHILLLVVCVSKPSFVKTQLHSVIKRDLCCNFPNISSIFPVLLLLHTFLSLVPYIVTHLL